MSNKKNIKLNNKQIEFLKEKELILDKTKNEIKAVLITVLKINNSKINKDKAKNIFQKYLIA